MEKKGKEWNTLIPEIKVVNFEPDEEPETILKIEDGPRYKDKTIPELKEMAKHFGLKVSGTRLELIYRIADETRRINDEKKKDAESNNLELIEGLRAQMGIKQAMLADIRKQRFEIVKQEDELEASINKLKLTLSTLEETLDVPDMEW
jgi:hypothetical protein